MNTRRGFLNASSVAMAAGLSNLSLLGSVKNGNEPHTTDIAAPRDYWNDFPNYLTSVVNTARTRRKADLAKIKTVQDAEARSAFIRNKIWELTGGLLEKTPLNVKAVGVIERSGYRIEKLLFESQPEFYVPAHLYVPTSGKGPFPGIISPLGHTPDGKAFPSYQTLFQNLAKKGFVVLTWDPPGQGERLQYPVHGTNRSRFGPTGEHAQFGYPALLIGSTTTQFETWDAVRALDYLVSRSEVDPVRIGCCGHSGGGTATMYLCALEPRIQAAVIVEGHTENVAGSNYDPPGAYADVEQNIIGSLKVGLDRGDLVGAFAPKPLLICFTYSDIGATYSPHYEQGTREIVGELKDLYTLYHAPEKVGLSTSILPHDYDFFHRRATYGWFNKWLAHGEGNDTEAEFDETPESKLYCTSTGQILTSVGGRTAYQVNFDRLRSIQANRSQAGIQKDQLRKTLRELLGLPEKESAMRSAALSSCNLRDITVEEFDFSSEPTIRVPGWFIKPASGGPKFGVAVVLLPSGKSHLFDEPDILAQVTKQNLALCAIDTRASGKATPRPPSSGPLFNSRGIDMGIPLVSLAAGVPLVGQRVWDVLRCLTYLTSRQDVDASRIGIFGRGSSGLEAIFAAALDERVRTVSLDHTVTDFTSLVAAEDYNLKVESFVFGLLKHFDLPDLCAAALAPRSVWLLNPVNPNGVGLSLSQVRERYTQRADHLSFHVQPDSTDALFGEWAKATLA